VINLQELFEIGRGIIGTEMNIRHQLSLNHSNFRGRRSSRFGAFFLLSTFVVFAILATAVDTPARSPQKKEKKKIALRWDPPHVDEPVPSLSAISPCSLATVLKQAGERAKELTSHLKDFDAHEQLRYEQTDDLGMPELGISAKFDYLVDFEDKGDMPTAKETRKLLSEADGTDLNGILDRGLPAFALIFDPSLQSDYEMRCEGIAAWNDQPAWVVYFHQKKDKRPRTLTIRSSTQAVPVSLKGRAWIAADSGQVMHLETNLVAGLSAIGLKGDAVSVDYAPVKFHSQDVEMWLPQTAVAYIDYGKRRVIVWHSFSDFQLFSVQTQQVIEKPKKP
jgi:hypothetical protein